ncbi:hypothetical protein IMCC3317_21450 [Kordia antarctica]|uniref:Lipoprotein n=1 Tax=Kordia antarctica TaxID=1218801 RepID=A0A7L4ZJI4_9FLAO|nr:hypothetical protein [Kordia antarctica]QHI36775.1 hypothetical protein IMCC3317_21450 [Kordia antarctica]
MKTRTILIAFTLLIGLFTACTDKKKTEDKPKTEIKSQDTTVDKAEKRRLDSIRQVKEHGHAH